MKTAKKTEKTKGLQYLIYPIDINDFVRQFWEKEAKLVSRNDLGYYKSLLTIDNVDQILDLPRSAKSAVRSLQLRTVLSKR